MKHRIPRPLRDGARVPGTFGFAIALPDGTPTDLPMPTSVRTWKQAVRHAAATGVYLWAHLPEWDRPHIHRRTATIHTLGRRDDPRLYTSVTSHPQSNRLYFEVSTKPIVRG